MVYRKFRIQVVIRVLLIGVFMAAFVFAVHQSNWYIASVISALLVLLMVISLIRYVERTNRDLGNFLQSIKNKDFSSIYSAKYSDKSYAPLHDAMNEVMYEFRNVRIEKEIHYQYLQMIIEHINVALICFDAEGDVHLVNQAARDLFNMKRLNSIEAIGKVDKKLLEAVKKSDTERGSLVKTLINGEMVGLSLKGTMFKVKEKTLKLVSLQNIKTELEEQELESWQKLIRVLTHEIMNSVTPVSSLSTAINEMLTRDGQGIGNLAELDQNDLEDMVEGMKTIEERSKGLLDFVGTYKNLTRLPKPTFTKVHVMPLLNHLKILMKSELGKWNIDLKIHCSEKDPVIDADHEMLERVLINLIMNAIDALHQVENPVITIEVGSRNHQTVIEVQDNGNGISPENIDKIFIPFFTTKKQGSGIGLSLTRQIMRLHKGSISVKSEPGEFTAFTLRF